MTKIGILDGIRVLTLEQVHALPWGTAFLADFGAQVIRVESVDHMQDRRSGPFPEGRAGAADDRCKRQDGADDRRERLRPSTETVFAPSCSSPIRQEVATASSRRRAGSR